METPKFNSQKYRDNLAKDLEKVKETDPEMAQKILSEEKETTRYKIADEFNSEKRPERVAFFNDLRNSIKEGNLEKYLEYKNSRNKIYKDGNLAEILNFSQEELQALAKKFLIDQEIDSHLLVDRRFEMAPKGQLTNAQRKSIEDFLLEIGYKPENNK